MRTRLRLVFKTGTRPILLPFNDIHFTHPTSRSQRHQDRAREEPSLPASSGTHPRPSPRDRRPRQRGRSACREGYENDVLCVRATPHRHHCRLAVGARRRCGISRPSFQPLCCATAIAPRRRSDRLGCHSPAAADICRRRRRRHPGAGAHRRLARATVGSGGSAAVVPRRRSTHDTAYDTDAAHHRRHLAAA